MDDLVISITLINNIFTMKRIGTLLSFIMLFAIVACTGDRGPQGPPGVNILGQVFETTVNFTPSNGYSVIVDIPNYIEIYSDDLILVYLLDDETDQTKDVWTPLPQTYFVNGGGTMIYSFNHTYFDVKLFLDADFPLNQLPSNFTHNQTFRIAVVPSEYADTNLTMDELMESDMVQWFD